MFVVLYSPAFRFLLLLLRRNYQYNAHALISVPVNGSRVCFRKPWRNSVHLFHVFSLQCCEKLLCFDVGYCVCRGAVVGLLLLVVSVRKTPILPCGWVLQTAVDWCCSAAALLLQRQEIFGPSGVLSRIKSGAGRVLMEGTSPFWHVSGTVMLCQSGITPVNDFRFFGWFLL